MEARSEAGESEVWLEVDDRDAVWPVTIDPTFTQQQKLEAGDAASPIDIFGSSVAMSGETVVVGAPGDDGGAGAAYVFVRSNGVWSQQQKLLAADAAPGDEFGGSVAISGETVVVGAPSAAVVNGIGDLLGSAYVFVRSSGVWSQQQELEAADAQLFDYFSQSVGISGETVVVGAPGDDGPAGLDQGSAYVFVRSGGVWSQQQKLEAADAQLFDRFGVSVGISGETVGVGAPSDARSAGSAYVFVRSGEVWNQQQKLVAADAALDDQFGSSVALSGETVVVGARFGHGAVSIDQGSAYVFVRSGEVWSEQQKLEAADAAAGDLFGFSVAISGETLVVGARSDDGTAGFDQGSAYVFAAAETPSATPPTITLKAPISLWPPNHKYRPWTLARWCRARATPRTATSISIAWSSRR